MRTILALTIALGLISGLLGALAYDQLGSDAGAAPPPPSPTQVREQNLDGSGFIRVHEQGTANVNVTNGSLPVSGTVNVGNFPPAPEGRLIELGNQSGATVEFPFVDVSDCNRISILARMESGNGIAISNTAVGSPEGTTRVQVALAGGVFNTSNDGVSSTASLVEANMTLPFLSARVNVSNGVGDVTAWIWCEP